MAPVQRLSDRQLEARIDALSYRGGPRPEGKTFVYAFEDGPDPEAPEFISGHRPWTRAGKLAARDAMDAFADVLDVSFRPAREGEAADLTFLRADDLGGSAGWGSFRYVGDDWTAWVAMRSDSATDRALLMHEIGHALALKHPGDYGGAPGPFLPAREDTTDYTVMSYEDGRHAPATLMIYDVAALQDRWGANDAAHLGRTRWTAPEPGEAAVIWDAGGRDALVHRGGSPARIDLREGAFSSLGGVNDVAIAYGTTIETAVGGGGDDRLTGNGARNTLKGGGGDDLLRGGARQDRLLGGAGDDRLDGQGGADRLKGGGGVDEFRYARGGGADVILDFEAGELVVLARVKGFRALDIADAGGDAQVTGRGVDLLLKGVAADDLDAGDFQFL
ncbi:M10 family metallopeptidase C-terminal domain-containing protein [Albimonas pacifica]|uniref:Peptidase M10 serralysin C terminal n=1 Tax=Albimonas pacifica TaxID=1114924 RepID=A0A1I3C4C9_9RHOB|nr:M10 family metallopeptidase C-terminal domain-containing protein [Albimonas pacifica]SFH69320.1 Peptidase M10 serralysin C terminal [Albimonas pacifica]